MSVESVQPFMPTVQHHHQQNYQAYPYNRCAIPHSSCPYGCQHSGQPIAVNMSPYYYDPQCGWHQPQFGGQANAASDPNWTQSQNESADMPAGLEPTECTSQIDSQTAANNFAEMPANATDSIPTHIVNAPAGQTVACTPQQYAPQQYAVWPAAAQYQSMPIAAPSCMACHVRMVPSGWHCPCAQSKSPPMLQPVATPSDQPQARASFHCPHMMSGYPYSAPYCRPSVQYFAHPHQPVCAGQPEMHAGAAAEQQQQQLDANAAQIEPSQPMAASPQSTRNGLEQTHSMQAEPTYVPAGVRADAVDDMDAIVRNSVDRVSRMHDAQRRFYRDFNSELKSGIYDRRSNGLDPRNMRQQQRLTRCTPREAMRDGCGGDGGGGAALDMVTTAVALTVVDKT